MYDPLETARVYLASSAPCGGIRIGKLRAACSHRHNSSHLASLLTSSSLASPLFLSNASTCHREELREGGVGRAKEEGEGSGGGVKRAAICLFGTLARYDEPRGAHHTVLWLTRHAVLPSLQERVAHANPNTVFDVFVHCWQVQHAGFLEQSFSPRRAEYGIRKACCLLSPNTRSAPFLACCTTPLPFLHWATQLHSQAELPTPSLPLDVSSLPPFPLPAEPACCPGRHDWHVSLDRASAPAQLAGEPLPASQPCTR